MKKSKFNQLFKKIIQENNSIINQQYLIVEDIQNILYKANNLIYETNYVLKCPNKVIQKTKQKVLQLIKTNNYNLEQINILDVFSFQENLNLNDRNLLNTIKQLFKNHNLAYFNVKIEGSNDIWFDKKGEFILPKEFTENLLQQDTLHYSYPRIKPLLINNKQFNNFIIDYKNDVKFLKTIYEKQQKAIQLFKKDILNFNDFGTIIIYPYNCTQDELNVDLPTLDEAIEHQCQHLYIFLLSLAKTCIYLGIYFSNNLKKSALTYQLKQKEFINLTGSYCNILIRIFKKIQQPKNIINFIKTVLDLSIYGKSNNDEKYKNALNSSAQFSRIREFYKAIYDDSKYGLYSKKLEDNKIIKIPVTIMQPNKKFNTLIKWTLKNFQLNLQKNK